MNGSWDVYLASPEDFVVADEVTNLAKERDPGDIESTPALICDYYYKLDTAYT